MIDVTYLSSVVIELHIDKCNTFYIHVDIINPLIPVLCQGMYSTLIRVYPFLYFQQNCIFIYLLPLTLDHCNQSNQNYCLSIIILFMSSCICLSIPNSHCLIPALFLTLFGSSSTFQDLRPHVSQILTNISSQEVIISNETGTVLPTTTSSAFIIHLVSSSFRFFLFLC